MDTFTEYNYEGSGSGDHGHFKGDGSTVNTDLELDSDDEDYDYNGPREGSADSGNDDTYDSVDRDTITTGNVSTLSPEEMEQIR